MILSEWIYSLKEYKRNDKVSIKELEKVYCDSEGGKIQLH